VSLINDINYYKYKKCVVAFSGGIDSVSLLHYLASSNIEHIRAIHINHNISPNALQWQEFCQAFCKNLHIPLEVFNISISSKTNIEEQARILRYQTLFSNLENSEILLTAHHKNDQVETVLLNLFRGSGVVGLAGMLEKNAILHRPFLHTTKEEITHYAKQHRLEYVDDESNFDTRFNRNFIRNDIIPAIQKNYPSVINNIEKTAKNQQESVLLLNDLAHIDIEKYNILKGVTLNIKHLLQLPEYRVKNIIYYHLRVLQFSPPSSNIMHTILQSLIAKNDRQTYIAWGEYEMRIFKQHLYFLPQQKPPRECQFFNILQHKKGFNIKYRTIGQRIQFSNKTHSQSVKKLMQEYNIPPWERENLRFYYIDDKLVAIEKIGFIQHNTNLNE
jgi:tRNA(Ile)-lysidine synthase